MTSRPLVLTTAFVTCLWMGLAAAAEAQAQTRFPGLDRNNDGQITREEWRGSDRSFQTHDWNNDGVLSGDEVRPGAQRNSNWETADHDPNRFERNISWTESGFSNLARAVQQIHELGPRVVVVKQGRYGAAMFTEEGFFAVPGFPLEPVVDPPEQATRSPAASSGTWTVSPKRGSRGRRCAAPPRTDRCSRRSRSRSSAASACSG